MLEDYLLVAVIAYMLDMITSTMIMLRLDALEEREDKD